MAVKDPSARRDGNNNVRAEYLRPVSHYRERAIQAGLPPELADWHGGDASWYTEALFQMHEARADLNGWWLVERLYELQDAIGIGLSELGITETRETGRLIPRSAQLMELREAYRDHAEGIRRRRKMRRNGK